MESIYLLLLFLYFSGCMRNVASQNATDEGRYITYTDLDNVTRVIDLKAKPDLWLLQRSVRLQSQDKYYLYTKNNIDKYDVLIMNNVTSVSSSHFNPSAQVVVVAHGWGEDRDSNVNSAIKNAYLQKYDVNVLIVDWSTLSKSNYVTATLGVPSVGRALGRFLSFLNMNFSVSLANVHLIGFSLGAHVMAIAGRQLGGRVARITGLDPAGPLWLINTNHLQPSDAVYVEGIHTDEKLLGTTRRVGDVDFYPNGGFNQPGCFTDVCNHGRSWKLFAASVTDNNFIGYKCDGLLWLQLNLCTGSTLHMGNTELWKNGNGMYRVNTQITN